MKTTHSFSIISSRNNAEGKRIHHGPPGAQDFIAIDGEGINKDGIHRYALLGVGSDQLIDEDGLSWDRIFEFLYSHYRKKIAFVGFFLGYDFNQWFKTLPLERAAMLLTEEGRAKRQRRRGKNPTPFPVRHKGWEFDILGMKRFKLRPQCCGMDYGCKCKKAPWMSICDTGGFFQSSFLTVIDPTKWPEPVVTEEEYESIKRGKEARSGQTGVDSDMRFYNNLENDVLCRVLKVLDKGLRSIGVCLPPTKWFGPGQAAQAWLSNEGVTKSEDLYQIIPQWALEAARASYFGGWFEIMMHGIIPGETHEYDINSAYPYIISQLPCLEHGIWTQGNGYPIVNEGELCLVRARVWTGSPLSHTARNRKIHIGAMLHRDNDGRIYRPRVTEGWFWFHELEAAQRAKCVSADWRKSVDSLSAGCYEWVKYEPCACRSPMHRVTELYLRRLAVGKDSPIGKACKLIYNSEYGKFAQSVGSPVFGNPIYASLITAGCRTMILNAIATHPEGKKDVAMVATDAVYFRHAHPSLALGSALGEWEHKARRNLCLFKPGVYWDDKSRAHIRDGNSPIFKARGINARDFARSINDIDRQFEEWSADPSGTVGAVNSGMASWPGVKFISGFAMTSCHQAIQYGKWQMAGWVEEDVELKQSSNPKDKRADLYFDGMAGVFRTEPRSVGLIHQKKDGKWFALWDCESVPYQKRFGMEDPFSDESREIMGLNPDGNNHDLVGYAWKDLENAGQ